MPFPNQSIVNVYTENINQTLSKTIIRLVFEKKTKKKNDAN